MGSRSKFLIFNKRKVFEIMIFAIGEVTFLTIYDSGIPKLTLYAFIRLKLLPPYYL